jgi:LmbE family N-acetylglucosaminyl deacetylase
MERVRDLEGIPYSKQRVLVLAPHADDETLGCGGIIQKYVQHRSPVRVVIASFSLHVSKRYKKETGAYETYQGEQRWKEFEQAMNVLGVRDYHVWFPDRGEETRHDGRLDTIPRSELVERIEMHLKEFRATVLLIPSVTKHQDHEALHRAAVAAVRPYYWNGSVFVYETDGEISFQPQLFIPLSVEEINRKMEALQAYHTQLGSARHPVNPDSMFHKAKFRGTQLFMDYAEAFEVLRIHG